MTSTDPQHTTASKEVPAGSVNSGDPEARRDDMWLEVSQSGEDDANNGQTVHEDDKRDSNTHHTNQANHNDDFPENAAIKKTGDDAMNTYGHAIETVEDQDDLDQLKIDQSFQKPKAQSSRDDAVAPHIAAAEREIEESKAGPIDIFDRIAQAAESQFDESRGNTAKRVSELVDDRRVGTKRWTPSKTMKERMAKLEAARLAATGTPKTTASAEEQTRPAAAAPGSSTAETVAPDKKRFSGHPQPAETAPDEPVRMSHPRAETETEDTYEPQDENAFEAASNDDEHDTDGLRVVPGARGRRRDRARKSQHDEEFEKVFDEEEKPSINSLRRKLRSAPPEDTEADTGKSSVRKKISLAKVMPAGPDDEDSEEGKTGLFSRMLSATRKKQGKKLPAEATEHDDLTDEEALIADFEADGEDDFLLEEDDNWQETIDRDRKKRKLPVAVTGSAIAVLFGGLGWFLYSFLLGG